jgi:hypothetical protein
MQPGEVEHTLGDDFATVHIGKSDKVARNRDINRTAEKWCVPSALRERSGPFGASPHLPG